MHTADAPDARSPLPSCWRMAALTYTAAGVAGIVACAMFPESEIAMLATIAGSLPWSLGLLTLDLAPGVAQAALLLLSGSWGINAALLWWLALRRGRRHTSARES